MGVDVVQRPVFCQQAFGCLFANAGHAGNVVRLVPDQGLVIHHLVGPDVEFVHHIIDRDEVLIIARQVDDGAVIDQLEQVAVARDDLYTQTLLGCPDRCGTEHIVGFISLHLEAGDIERIHHLADALHLRAQIDMEKAIAWVEDKTGLQLAAQQR